MSPMATPRMIERTTIILVALISSSRVGQVTFRISSRTPTRKSRAWPTQPTTRLG